MLAHWSQISQRLIMALFSQRKLEHHFKPPPHEVQAEALRDGNVLMFVCLSPITKRFRATVCIADQQKVLHGLFREPILGPLAQQQTSPCAPLIAGGGLPCRHIGAILLFNVVHLSVDNGRGLQSVESSALGHPLFSPAYLTVYPVAFRGLLHLWAGNCTNIVTKFLKDLIHYY